MPMPAAPLVRRSASRAACAALCLVAATTATARDLVPIQTFSGRMPLEAPPLLQPALTTAAELAHAWNACKVPGTPPKLDFKNRLVLVAVQQSSKVSFQRIMLDVNNVKTNVLVAPDMPGYRTCAFAVIDRKHVQSVNGLKLPKP